MHLRFLPRTDRGPVSPQTGVDDPARDRPRRILSSRRCPTGTRAPARPGDGPRAERMRHERHDHDHRQRSPPTPSRRPANGVPITTFRVASKAAPLRPRDRAPGSTARPTGTPSRRTAGSPSTRSTRCARADRVVLTGRLRVRNWDTGEKRGTSVDIDADAIGHDLLFGTSTFRSDEPGSAGSSSTTESWTAAETERRRVGRARRRAGRLERVRSDDRADRRDDRRRHRARRARTRGGGDAVLRRRDERSGWRALDSPRVPPPRASSHAPRRGPRSCCVGLRARTRC